MKKEINGNKTAKKKPVKKTTTASRQKPGVKPKYTVKQIAEAIRKTNGLLTYTARELGCHYHTVRNYINKHAELQQEYEDIQELVLDLAENNIRQDIKAGSVETAKWYMRYKGRARGFIDKETNDPNVTLVTEVPQTEEARKLGIDYIRALADATSNG